MSLFIPIIGSISAGKSTFLKGFLGVDQLETGINTTTKFVCLIKNSSSTSFYHTILKRQNDNIIITKEGEEIRDLNKIKDKVKEINKKYNVQKAKQDQLFYMLETPIKNIDNPQLLNNCIFMDIPGLNEGDTNYIEDIFSLIKLNNILFEIFIFDSTTFESDKLLNIIRNIDGKKCLQKEGNLYILNKIDNITPGGENSIIDQFKFHFYKTFEKDNPGESKIYINFYQNHFIPVNSILYRAEKKLDNDFTSWLTVELFYYIQSTNNETTFFDYLEKRLENVISQNQKIEGIVEKEYDNVKDNEMDKISDGVEEVKNILAQTEKKKEFIFGINIEKPKSKKLLIKLFILHKNKVFVNAFFSEYHEKLNEIIKKIKITKEDNLSSPPPVSNQNNTSNNYKENGLLKEMNDFLKERLENQYEELNSYLRVINENIFGRKIRVSFIGPMSVGKSTILNCIIGKELLPMEMKECTYRGIIIKHDPNLKDFYLYKTIVEKVNPEGGIHEFYNFKEESKPYCYGAQNIYAFLKNKNNDKDINSDNEAFLIVKGKLKIFDYIKLEQELMNKLEFVDLPGYDRENNEFIRKRHHHKIIKYSNSCVYINTAENIDDDKDIKTMENQYKEDKGKLFGSIQNRFIDTCLFVINKSDKYRDEEERQKTKANLINIIITNIEKNVSKNPERINVSFFSGKCFFDYLNYYEMYVTNMENNPIVTLNYLYKEWSKNKLSFLGLLSFRKFIIKNISEKIEDEFEEEIENKSTPNSFYNNLKNSLNQFYNIKQRTLLSQENEEKEVIDKLYNIYDLFKKKDFSNTKYSNKFFHDIKKIVLGSEQLQKENFYLNFQAFFQSADFLFKREVKEEMKKLKEKGHMNYYLFKDTIAPETEKVLIEKENCIKQIINSARNECIKEIEAQISDVETVLNRFDYDIEKAYKDLESKISKIIEKMKEDQEKITNKIIDDIKERSKEKIKSFYQSQNLPINEARIRIEETFLTLDNILAITLLTIANILGYTKGIGGFVAFSIGVGLALSLGGFIFVALGVVGGAVIAGIAFTVGYFFAKYKKKKKYKEILEKLRDQVREKFEDILYTFSDHYKTFKDTLIKELKLKIEVYLKRINNDETEWKQIQEEYERIKGKTLKIAKEKFNV